MANITEMKNFYLRTVSYIIEPIIKNTLCRLYIYHNDENKYKENLLLLAENISDNEIHEEILKIENKKYFVYLKCLFKCYIVFLTFGLQNDTSVNKYYDAIDVAKFTKRVYQYYIENMNNICITKIVEHIVVEFLPMQNISKIFLEMPITKHDQIEKIKKKMRNN